MNEFSFDKLNIGGSLTALMHAYTTETPIIIDKPQLPFELDKCPPHWDLRFLGFCNKLEVTKIQVWERLSFLLSEISFIKQIYENDQDKEKALKSYKGLLTGNDSWDNGEPYVDLNKNLAYDEEEEFTDWSFPKIGYIHLLISDIFKRSIALFIPSISISLFVL